MWPEISAKGWCGEWADKAITPEQDGRRELVRQFAVAFIASGRDCMMHEVWKLAAEMADAEPGNG